MSFQRRLVSLIVVDSLIVFTSVYICSFLLFSGCVVPRVPLAMVSASLLLSHHLFAYRYKLYKEPGSMRVLVR